MEVILFPHQKNKEKEAQNCIKKAAKEHIWLQHHTLFITSCTTAVTLVYQGL